jgi:pimeloyl-ACP methyl ester carboxylesterase
MSGVSRSAGRSEVGVRVSEVDEHRPGRSGTASELVVRPGGHCPQEDDPADWLAAVRTHLSRAA